MQQKGSVSTGKSRPAHSYPDPISRPLSWFSKTKNRERKGKKSMSNMSSCCAGWWSGPPAVSHGWSEPPSWGDHRAAVIKANWCLDTAELKSSFFWWIRPFSHHSDQMCVWQDNYFHSFIRLFTSVRDNAVKAALLSNALRNSRNRLTVPLHINTSRLLLPQL